MTPFAAMRLRKAALAAATDPLFSYVKFLCHCDGVPGAGTFVDVTGKTIFNSTNTTTETAYAAFGPTGAKINSGYFGTAHHADFVLGTQAFCLEFVVTFDGVSGVQVLAVKQTGTGVYPYQLALNVTPGKLTWRGFNASVGLDLVITGATTITTGRHHVALVHDGAGTFVLGYDGVNDGAATITPAARYNDPADQLFFGATGAPSAFLDGGVDEPRFTIGHPRYTSFPYAVPAAAHPNS